MQRLDFIMERVLANREKNTSAGKWIVLHVGLGHMVEKCITI